MPRTPRNFDLVVSVRVTGDLARDLAALQKQYPRIPRALLLRQVLEAGCSAVAKDPMLITGGKPRK